MAAAVPQLLLATCTGTACFRVCGKPSLDLSGQLRQAGERLVLAGHSRVVIDLRECPSADSTFIGVLLMLTKKVARLSPPGRVMLLGPVELVRHQLDSLGVLDRFELVDATDPAMNFETLALDPAGKEQTARVCLEAHQGLIEANEANARKFKDVVEFLQRDVDRLDGPKPG